MLRINWKSKIARKPVLYFSDLGLNQPFRNAGYRSQGAVYIKVVDQNENEWMYEVATGRLWVPTTSPVEKIDLDMNVPVEKPALYV